jgi:Phospholipase_D-nuclease N-terminal
MLALFMLGGGEIILLLAIFFFLPLGLLGTAFWIWMLVDCVKNERISSDAKIVWVLVIALTHFIGAIIYFFVGRQPRRAAT